MPDPRSWYVVEKGWKVVTAEGTDVGTVDEVLGDETADIFDGLVDNLVELDVDAFTLGSSARVVIRTHVETDDDRT